MKTRRTASKKSTDPDNGDEIGLTPKRSPCPVASLLDILGDKWTLLVVRDLFWGKQTYGELLDSAEGIPTNILAERLKRLIQAGIVEKQPYRERPLRYAYRLTKKGKELIPVMEEMVKWANRHIPGTYSMAQIRRWVGKNK